MSVGAALPPLVDLLYDATRHHLRCHPVRCFALLADKAVQRVTTFSIYIVVNNALTASSGVSAVMWLGSPQR